MNRFFHFLEKTSSMVGVTQHRVGLEWGNQVTRLIVDGRVRAQTPSQLPGLSGRHPQLQNNQVTRHGTVSDIQRGQSILRKVFEDADIATQWQARYQGWCVVPSQATVLEKNIMKQVLAGIGWMSWRLISKTELSQQLLPVFFADEGIHSVIDIGPDSTEITIGDKESVSQAYGATIWWGTAQLESALQATVRDQYQVQLSQQSVQTIITQLKNAVLLAETANADDVLAIRAQEMTTGRPTTARLKLADIQPVFMEWFRYLTEGLSLLLHQQQQQSLTTILEQGVVVVGEGAAIADTVPALADFLQVSTTTIPEPDSWITKGLQLITKQTKS